MYDKGLTLINSCQVENVINTYTYSCAKISNGSPKFRPQIVVILRNKTTYVWVVIHNS